MKKVELKTLFEADNRNYIEFLYSEVDKLASELIYEKYPQYKQINASLGLYDSEFVDNMKLYISQIIRASKILKSKIKENKIITKEEINKQSFYNYI